MYTPEGRLFIDDLLYLISKYAKHKYKGRFEVEFESSHVTSRSNKIDAARPCYNLVITYNDTRILVVEYEFDVRFSMEMTEDRLDKIEDVLCNEAVAQICTLGIDVVMQIRQSGAILYTTKKESDERKYFSLN